MTVVVGIIAGMLYGLCGFVLGKRTAEREFNRGYRRGYLDHMLGYGVRPDPAMLDLTHLIGRSDHARRN